jgi:hypothetical protein
MTPLQYEHVYLLCVQIFGFLNLMVWVGNLWFLYKETPWFKVQAKPPAGTPGMPSDLDLDPQKV